MATSNDRVRISAHVSAATKTRLDACVRDHGIKRSYLIERALQHHLAALEAIPPDVVIPLVVVVSRESGTMLAKTLENPPPPTEAIKALFADCGGESPVVPPSESWE
jgi:hypothetical protein